MDTISRENNSMLPVGSIIVGVVALLLGGFALVQASKVKNQMAEAQPKIDKIEGIEQQAAAAAAAAEKSNQNITKLNQETQTAFNTVSTIIGDLQTKVTKMEEAAKKPAVSTRKGGAPAVAGPDEYIVKSGDYGAKIARALGVSLSDLQSVNPGTDLAKLRVGQKLKTPRK